jgi:hypothetical protein
MRLELLSAPGTGKLLAADATASMMQLRAGTRKIEEREIEEYGDRRTPERTI